MLDRSQLEELKQFDGPTICNAIEFFNIRQRVSGFTNPSIRKIFHNSKRNVGYVVTGKISAVAEPKEDPIDLLKIYYDRLHRSPRPTIAVIQDIDPVPTGSFWGEVHAAVHVSLECEALISSGGVRDLDEVEALGFEFYSSCILLSHGYVHLTDVDCDVEVGGLTVYPGQLIFADKHGVISIPDRIAPYLADACREAQKAELPVLSNCKTAVGDVTPDDLIKWRKEMLALRASAEDRFSGLV